MFFTSVHVSPFPYILKLSSILNPLRSVINQANYFISSKVNFFILLYFLLIYLLWFNLLYFSFFYILINFNYIYSMLSSQVKFPTSGNSMSVTTCFHSLPFCLILHCFCYLLIVLVHICFTSFIIFFNLYQFTPH